MQPIVDGIESQYASVLTVYQLDYNQPAEQRIAHAYAVRSHPVLLVIDQTGVPVARFNGIVSEAEIVLALRNLVALP
jgi:thioredoxin-like negative regulator of GroEL